MNANFDAFCRAEYANVYRAAFAFTGDRDSALDATQEAFSRAFARWNRLSREQWVGGWVMTTALNLCRGSRPLRRARRSLDPSRPDQDPDLRIDISTALRELPLRQRQALLLHYLADLPVAAVADLMGASEGTVKTHLSRGRVALGRVMTNEGGPRV